MTDNSGGTPPFSIPGFSGFGQADMMGKMWEMMRLNPFAAAMSGGGPGVGSSGSMMSDMLAPLTNVEELDKRITDMRAVEQWLKLNLSMLQSAIQALEVQRATLATLRAFGAFAQTSVQGVQNAAAEAPTAASRWPMGGTARQGEPQAPPQDESAQSDTQLPPGFDPGGWWNVLQSQFNQLAHLAMLQPGMAGAPTEGDAQPADAGANASQSGDTNSASTGEKPDATAFKRPAARKAPPRKKGE